MQLADLSRILANIIRISTVVEVDHDNARCKVLIGETPSNWLPFASIRAGNTQTWSPPTVGEQVLVLSPSGETANGIVMTGIYSDAHAAPSNNPDEHVTKYPDGAKISYNHVSGALVAQGIKTGLIQAETSITLDTPKTHVTGELEVDKLITYHNGMDGEAGDHGGAVTITGNLIHNDGVLQSNGIVLHDHDHASGVGQPT